jgi:hypothetical protein
MDTLATSFAPVTLTVGFPYPGLMPPSTGIEANDPSITLGIIMSDAAGTPVYPDLPQQPVLASPCIGLCSVGLSYDVANPGFVTKFIFTITTSSPLVAGDQINMNVTSLALGPYIASLALEGTDGGSFSATYTGTSNGKFPSEDPVLESPVGVTSVGDVTNGNAVITLTAGDNTQYRVGDELLIAGSNVVTVLSINNGGAPSTTHVTLDAVYAGSTATGLTIHRFGRDDGTGILKLKCTSALSSTSFVVAIPRTAGLQLSRRGIASGTAIPVNATGAVDASGSPLSIGSFATLATLSSVAPVGILSEYATIKYDMDDVPGFAPVDTQVVKAGMPTPIEFTFSFSSDLKKGEKVDIFLPTFTSSLSSIALKGVAGAVSWQTKRAFRNAKFESPAGTDVVCDVTEGSAVVTITTGDESLFSVGDELSIGGRDFLYVASKAAGSLTLASPYPGPDWTTGRLFSPGTTVVQADVVNGAAVVTLSSGDNALFTANDKLHIDGNIVTVASVDNSGTPSTTHITLNAPYPGTSETGENV